MPDIRESIRSTISYREIISARTGKGKIETDQTPHFKQILVLNADKENRLGLCIPCLKGLVPAQPI